MTLAQLVVTIAIELTAIAVILIVGAVILMEKEQGTKQTKMQCGGVVKHKPVRESEWVFPLTRSRVICWVPIEERLPDDGFETVLFTLEWDDTGLLEVCADTYYQMSLWVQGRIVAWAKLPEPYKK